MTHLTQIIPLDEQSDRHLVKLCQQNSAGAIAVMCHKRLNMTTLELRFQTISPEDVTSLIGSLLKKATPRVQIYMATQDRNTSLVLFSDANK